MTETREALMPEEIAELKRLLAKATTGPWGLDSKHQGRETGLAIVTTPTSAAFACIPLLNSSLQDCEANAALIVAMRNALPALLDLAASLASAGEDEELCKRLRYNASIWQRKADDDHPLVKDQLDAANAIDRLAYQAQGHCRDAKHAKSVADELRRLLEKEKERADKFMWQVRDTCARAEKAETREAALRAENERLRKALDSLSYPDGHYCAV